MFKKNIFSYVVTSILLGLAAYFDKSAYAYAAVGALVVTLFRDIIEQKVFSMKDIKLTIPEDMRKQLADMSNRLSTLEYNITQRGF